MITYNHEDYIVDAIEGVLSQKCNFNIELIIADDNSPDKTQAIIQDFKDHQNSHWIKYVKHVCNKGVVNNFLWACSQARGKYIALCEGDDYWMNSDKLQMQFDFMENNESISFCCHNAATHYIDSDLFVDFNKKLSSGFYITKDLLSKEWFIPTASLFFRNSDMPKPMYDWYYSVYSADYALELILSLKGDFYYFSEKMSVYRKNALNSLSANQKNPYNHLLKKIELLNHFRIGKSLELKLFVIYAILKTRFQIARAKMYIRYPYIFNFKNRLKAIQTF
jgi:glycosyltransferase involved in cell wall biosynthesis